MMEFARKRQVSHQPSDGEQIVLFYCLGLNHKLPDSGEHQFKSRP